MDLADHVPADAGIDEALLALHFLIKRFGGLRKAMAAEQHGHTGQCTADIADRVAFAAKAERVILPLGILLGMVDEPESHDASCEGTGSDGLIIDERGKERRGNREQGMGI